MSLHQLFLFPCFFIMIHSAISQDSRSIQLADSTANTAWQIHSKQPLEAIKLFEEAMQIYRKTENWEPYIDAANKISFIQYRQFRKTGDGQAFFENAKKTLSEAEAYLGKKNRHYAAALSNLGLAYKNYRVDLQKALSYYHESIKIMQEVGEEASSLAASYYNIGKLCRTFGDYDEGIRYLQKAKELFNQNAVANQKKIADTYMSIGHHYREKKAYSAALENYYKHLRIAKQLPKLSKSAQSNLIYTYHSVSRIYAEQSQFDSAGFYLQKAFDFHDQGISSRQMQSYENLAYYHQQQEHFKEALTAYQQANTIAEQRYSAPKHRIKSRMLKLIADSHSHLNDHQAALEYYQKALVMLAFDFEDSSPEQNPAPDQFISMAIGLDIIAGKAHVFYQRFLESQEKQDLSLALQHYQFATEVINEQRRNFLADGSKHTLAAKALTVYEGAIETTLQLYQLTNQPQYLEEAFSYAERNKSLLLLESMQENVAKVAGQLSQDDLLKEKELNREIAFLEKQIMDQKSKGEQRSLEKIKQWESELFDSRLQYQELVASFEKKYPDYYQLKHQIQPSSVAQLRKQLLDNKTALFEYFVGNDHIYAFCITAENMKVEKIKRTEALSNSLDQLTALISQPPFKQDLQQVFADFSASSWMLSEQLTQPLIASLPPAIKRLIIIPDDQLAYLPFELLLTKKPAANNTSFSPKQFAYLIKRYAISYNYSATLLLNHLKQKRSRRLKPLIGFAPSFSNGPIAASRECFDGEVYSLQCNGEEVKAINEIFNGQQQLGKQANLATFKKMAKDYRIIHLATHACAGESDALNKIYFADGYLTNFDLPNLELNAELAVLSACNTGSGQLVKGEGVMSLSRGFTLANCPSTLMSLWTVDDCITSDLMLRFYKKLKAGQSKDEALQQTKIEHLEAADKAGMHPYYWAAFLQSGNAAPIDFSNHWNYWWGLPAMLIFMLLLFWRRRRA